VLITDSEQHCHGKSNDWLGSGNSINLDKPLFWTFTTYNNNQMQQWAALPQNLNEQCQAQIVKQVQKAGLGMAVWFLWGKH
jgi:hypothetical protein